MLADLERAKGNLQSWGEMLDLCVDGYFILSNSTVKKQYFPASLLTLLPSQACLNFWGIADVIGSHDILWTLSTDATPRMVEFLVITGAIFRRCLPLALKTCRRMLLFRDTFWAFFRNIQFISFCQKQTVYCKPTSVCPFIGNHTSLLRLRQDQLQFR